MFRGLSHYLKILGKIPNFYKKNRDFLRMQRELRNFLRYSFKRKKVVSALGTFVQKHKYPLLLLGIFLFSALFLVKPWVHGNDGVGYYAPLRSFIIDSNLNLSNEYLYYEESQPVPISAISENPETGMWYSQYPIGTALAWFPFFLMGHVTSLIFRQPMTGYTSIYYWFVNMGSALLAFGALLAIYYFVKKRWNETIAFWSVLTGLLATNLVYYMFIEATMSHAIQFFVMTVFILLWLTIRHDDTKKWFILGLFAAWIFMVRLQDGILWLLPALTSLTWYYQFLQKKEWKSMQALVLSNLVFVGGILLMLLPQLLANYAYHGSILEFVRTYTGNFEPSQWWFSLKVLFSPDSGLFFWLPVTLLGIVGLCLQSKVFSSPERRKLLLVFILQVIITGFWNGWNSAQSYGQRFFVGYIPLFIFGFAILQERIRWKTLLRIIFIVYIIINGILLVQYGLRMIPSFGPLDTRLVIQNIAKFPEMFQRLLGFFGGNIQP
jgi:hypothetical protein